MNTSYYRKTLLSFVGIDSLSITSSGFKVEGDFGLVAIKDGSLNFKVRT
jgi:hypothetical protein